MSCQPLLLNSCLEKKDRTKIDEDERGEIPDLLFPGGKVAQQPGQQPQGRVDRQGRPLLVQQGYQTHTAPDDGSADGAAQKTRNEGALQAEVESSERIDRTAAHPGAPDDHPDTEREAPEQGEGELLRRLPLLGKERFAKGLRTSQQRCQGGDNPQFDQQSNQYLPVGGKDVHSRSSLSGSPRRRPFKVSSGRYSNTRLRRIPGRAPAAGRTRSLPARRNTCFARSPPCRADHSRKNGRSLMKMNHEWTRINTNRPEDRWSSFNH